MMNEKEAKRITVIQEVVDRRCTNQQAAEKLGIQVRQVQRLKRKMEQGGIFAMLHGNRGKKPYNATPPKIVEQYMFLIRVESETADSLIFHCE